MSFAVESVAPSKAGGLGLKPAFESQWVPEHVEETMSEEDILLRKTNTIVLTGSDVEAKREEIRLYFHRTFTVYEKLFEVLSDKAYYMRADRLRHPLIFYYGHTATFFINKMTIAGIIKERINPHYESLFAVGVDEMSWDDLLPESFDWPTVEEVKAYRDKAREVVDHAIRTTPLTLPIAWNDQFWCFLMGIEHERIHLETSSVLIRQLPLSVLKPHAFWNRCAKFSTEVPENELLPVIDNSQLVSLGKATDHPLYGWDNEYGTQTSMVAPFKASRYLVTNKEFLDFMEDGGYSKQEFWTEEGWRWANFRRAEKASHPLFWVPVLEEIPSMKQTISAAVKGAPSLRAPIGDSESDSSSSVGEDLPKFRMTYKFRTMLEEMEMPWDWPVETNYLEAKAFCNWKSAKTGKCIRLPMEDEYEVLRAEVDGDHPYWARAPGNLNLEYYCSSTPVTAFPPSRNGFYDVVGNVWQHTETPIDAFRGFRVHPWYDDFSVPTFDLQHNIIKGGSWISTGNEASNLSRYAFRRHFFQHAGFRYIETQRPVEVRNDIYERDSAVTLYAEMHYGLTEYLGVKNYPQTVASLCAEWAKGRPTRRALDMGCAVGRATFELARTYDYVVGLDFSARFIRMGVNLKEHGAIHYSVVEEGALTSDRTVTLDDLKLAAVKDKVEFFQADACNLDPRYNNYDLVLASNMIDRLYDPRLFLRTIRERINVGGLLVILDPYTWLEEHTPRECWLGGYMDRFGKEISTLEALKEVLAPHFRLVAGPTSIPVVLREHKRKFQYLNSEATCWERVQVE